MMKINCVIAVTADRSGSPNFASVTVECSQEQYDSGDHYDAARNWASGEGYDGPFVVYDQNDGPAWLLDHFPPDDDVISILDS
jgi:hypothetical protein